MGAAKRDSLGVALKAAWEDLEEAIAEAAAYFGHAVEAKLAWINKIHYYGLRQELLDRVSDLRAAWAAEVTGLRQEFADEAEERRLQADASIAKDQDDFEVFAAAILDTCDGNRVTQSAILEGVISETRTSFDELLGYCRKALDSAIAGEIKGLKEFLSSQYGYAGHAPGPHSQKPQQKGYFEEEEQDHTDAVQEFVHHVSHPQAEQAQHIIQWLQTRKTTLEGNIAATEDQLEAKQLERAEWEANGFGEQVAAWIDQSGSLAATLLKDVQAKNDAVQATLDDLKNTHYGHVDAHGYRYKLLHQLHHQRVAFEQAVEAAWTTWTQSRDHTLDTAAATAGGVADAFEQFLVQRIGEWEGASNGVRQAMAGQLAERGENLKGAIQQATKVFQEKQAYKRNYIANVQDAAKAASLTEKVDLEDQLYQEAVKKIWADFGDAGREMLSWLDTFLNSEGDDLVAAQDNAGNALADALSGELDRLSEALGAIGDAFFQAKHDETERLMAALYERGYGEYQAGYEPVFVHQDEEVEEPYHHEEEEDDYHTEEEYHYEEEVVEEVVYEEPVVEEEESYHYEEEVVYEPVEEEVVVEEPVEEEVVYEEEVVESYHEEEEEDDHYYESESESSYSSETSYVSYESSSSYYYGHGHSHG